MKLIRLHIDNFGNLSDFDLTFDSNPTILMHENGWGKSTLAAFIKVMFYGFSGENKKTSELREREKYRPWNGKTYGGVLCYEAGGVEYELSKVFGAKEKEDSCVLKNMATGLPVEHVDSAHMGLDLFALDERSFKRSVFIAQNDVRVHEEGHEDIADGISAKIGKLSDATDDVNRYETVMERLNDLLNRMSPKRATGSIKQMSAHISTLQNALRQEENLKDTTQRLTLQLRAEQEKAWKLEQERNAMEERFQKNAERGELLARKEAHQQLWDRYEESRKQLEELEKSYVNGLPEEADVNAKLELWTERETLSGTLENKELQLSYLIKEDAEAKARSDTKKEEYLEEKRYLEHEREKIRKAAILLLGLSIILFVGGAVTVFVLSRLEIGAGIIAGGGICMLTALILMLVAFILKKGAAYDKYEEPEEDAEEQADNAADIGEIKARIAKDRDRIAIIETNVEEFLRYYQFTYEPETVNANLYEIRQRIALFHAKADELEKKREEIKKFEKANDMTSILNTEEGDARGDARSLQKEREENSRLLKETQESIRLYIRQLDENRESLQGMADMRSELANLTEQRDADLHRYEMLTLTRDYLKAAKQNFSAKYRRPLLDGFKKYYGQLSGEEVSEFELDANIHMTKRVLGEARKIENYSSGNRDLADICLRMALVDAMYQEEKPFVIFDDPFVNLDEERTKRALSFIGQVAKDYQVIYFTCHPARAPFVSHHVTGVLP